MSGEIVVQAASAPDPASSAERVLTERLRPLVPRLTAYFARRVEPIADAADAVSDTLLALWRHRERWPVDESDLRAYAYGVARGVLANQRRSRRRQSALADRVRGAVAVDGGTTSIPETLDVRAALAQLHAKDRELVMLVVWDGLGVAEAGALLGLSATASRARYSRARARLRAALE